VEVNRKKVEVNRKKVEVNRKKGVSPDNPDLGGTEEEKQHVPK
jgi:hypothetical protein